MFFPRKNKFIEIFIKNRDLSDLADIFYYENVYYGKIADCGSTIITLLYNTQYGKENLSGLCYNYFAKASRNTSLKLEALHPTKRAGMGDSLRVYYQL